MKPATPSSLTDLVPALGWLRTYQPGWLRADLVAGLTLAAYLLPAGLGDASLANLPPQAGLYACLFGGLSQSLVNEGGGARTPLSGAVAAGIILVVVLFFSSLLNGLPKPVLAAIVLVAVAGLFNVSALKHLWRADRTEFLVAMAAIVGVLGQGLLRGVMIGAIISLVLLIRRVSRPHVATLGRIPGTRRFSDQDRHPDNERIPGVLIVRPESGLLYFNMDHVRDTIAERVRTLATSPKLVVLDLSAAPRVDLHSTIMLGSLAADLAAAGIRVQAVEARAAVRERLRSEGVDAKLGAVDRFTTVADAVEAFQQATPNRLSV